jgi:hypothetical protein
MRKGPRDHFVYCHEREDRKRRQMGSQDAGEDYREERRFSKRAGGVFPILGELKLVEVEEEEWELEVCRLRKGSKGWF